MTLCQAVDWCKLNDALFAEFFEELRAQIDDAKCFKAAKRRPKNEHKQVFEAKEESSDDGMTAFRKRKC